MHNLEHTCEVDIYLLFFFCELRVYVNCSESWKHVFIYKNKSDIPLDAKHSKFDYITPNRRKRAAFDSSSKCNQIELPMVKEEMNHSLSAYSMRVC